MVFKIARVFLVFAVPALLACGGGGGGGSTPTSTNSSTNSTIMTVQVGDDSFSPKDIQIQPGTTVRWVMAGVHPGHTVTDSGGAFNSGMVFASSGASFDRLFTSADSGKTFNYFCQTHVSLGMKGSVQVGQNAAPPSPGY